MVTKTKKRRFTGSKKRFIGKPAGQIQERVQAVGPEHFGVVAVDCAKRRSKWMLCNFFGKVIIEPTSVQHTSRGLRAMTQLVTETWKAEGLTDMIVAHCIPTKRPTTTILKRSSTRRSMVMAWRRYRLVRCISRCKRCHVIGITWSSNARD